MLKIMFYTQLKHFNLKQIKKKLGQFQTHIYLLVMKSTINNHARASELLAQADSGP
jgi:hypothetical protein